MDCVVKKILRLWMYLKASGLALVGYYQALGAKAASLIALRVGVFIVRSLFREDTKIAQSVWKSRIRKCYKCPVYNKELKSCGSLGMLDDSGRQMGCLCYIPFKARYKSSSCWLQSLGLDTNWYVGRW